MSLPASRACGPGGLLRKASSWKLLSHTLFIWSWHDNGICIHGITHAYATFRVPVQACWLHLVWSPVGDCFSYHLRKVRSIGTWPKDLPGWWDPFCAAFPLVSVHFEKMIIRQSHLLVLSPRDLTYTDSTPVTVETQWFPRQPVNLLEETTTANHRQKCGDMATSSRIFFLWKFQF